MMDRVRSLYMASGILALISMNRTACSNGVASNVACRPPKILVCMAAAIKVLSPWHVLLIIRVAFNEEVLKGELGLSEQEMETLRRSGAIGE